MGAKKTDQDIRQIILEVAEKEFLEKGFGMARTTEIAKRAGVNHAMLHYYFQTKELLFVQVYEKKIHEITSSIKRIIEQDLPFLEKLKIGIEAHFDFFVENPLLPHFLLNEFIVNPKRLDAYKSIIYSMARKVYSTLQEGIADGVKEGSIRPIRPLHLLYNIIALDACIFLMQPAIDKMAMKNSLDYKQFLEERKAENVEAILSRLRR